MSVYASLLENGILPVADMVRQRTYSDRRRFLEDSQWWSADALRDFQWGELQRLLATAFNSVPFYQNRFAAAGISLGDIKSWDDFRRLPFLTADDIRNHKDELCSTQYPGRLISHSTGGSTGNPKQFFITIESYDWRTACTQRAYNWGHCRLGDPSVYLWGQPLKGGSSSLRDMKLRLHRMLQRQQFFPTYKQTEALWEQVFAELDSQPAKPVVGFVSSLRAFSQYLVSKGRRCRGVQSVLTAAEPLFEEDRALIENVMGAPVFNTYGSREFMSVAGECDRHDGLHVHAENLIVESVQFEPGATPELVITDLHNDGMPFLRYRTGDSAVIDDSPCGCGRSLPRLKGLEGRVLELLSLPDGSKVGGGAFCHLFKDIEEVVEFQVEQVSLDRIDVHLVLRSPLSDGSRDTINEAIRVLFGAKSTVNLVPVKELKRTPSGKRRVTIGLAPVTRT